MVNENKESLKEKIQKVKSIETGGKREVIYVKDFKQFIKELKDEIKVKDKEELRLEDGFIYRSDVIDIINKLSGFGEENG